MTKFYKKGQVFGRWTLVDNIGFGGNGEVWECVDPEGNKGAIKLLKKIKPKAYARFRDETTVLERNADIVGIIPMIDKSLPEALEGAVPFYVMPIAESAEEKLTGARIEAKIDAVLQVCETLDKLHERGISHRDIKPPNMLYYNGRYAPVDFGLVDFPDKGDVSSNNEEIGARWTIAPEMKRTSSSADGRKADVYSLAKTIWIILADVAKGFDGQYTADSIIGLQRYFPEHYLAPLDKLLVRCTDNDPNKRPTVTEVIAELKEWKILNEDFHEMNNDQWLHIQKRLFPAAFPKRVIWENIDDIITILNIACSYSNLNHMFFPSSGGLDLKRVLRAGEEGCIELDASLPYILKPKRLIFESFGDDPSWNYFRLELETLEPSGVYETDENEETDEQDAVQDDQAIPSDLFEETRKDEELTELYPGDYTTYQFLENRDYYEDEGREIPETARHITRLLEGSLVIFNKRSHYNLNHSTYDGRHDKMTTDEFRNYIQWNADGNKSEDIWPYEKLRTDLTDRRRKVSHYE